MAPFRLARIKTVLIFQNTNNTKLQATYLRDHDPWDYLRSIMFFTSSRGESSMAILVSMRLIGMSLSRG